MTETATLLALADRVEREPPSRELDAEIAKACGVAGKERNVRSKSHFVTENDGRSRGVLLRVAIDYPPLTTSLDAAMTLVPEDCTWSVHGGATPASVELYPDDGGHIEADAPTPAAALTAAALRVRAGMEKTDG